MKLFVVGSLVAVCAVALATESSGSDALDSVPYPEGFRQWTHVKSAVTVPQGENDKRRRGIHHIYANEKALEGYKTGRWADGAVIAFDLLDVTVNNGATTEGPRKLVDVMHRDSARYAATGGWGFEEFAGDTRTPLLGEKAVPACFNCHTSRKEQSFVFSSWRP
jgi:hypothetical protein